MAELIALSDAQLQAEPPSRTRARKGLFLKDARVSARQTTSIMIICGNCAGEALNPCKTLLDTKGKCATCGGSSYAIASALVGGRYVMNEE